MTFGYRTIRQAMQVLYDSNLNIVASHFRRRDQYVDEHGEIQTGPTCGLLLRVDDLTMPWHGDQYYVGQDIVYGKYLIRIVEIDRDEYGPFARVGVTELKDPPAEWQVTIPAEGDGPYEIPPNTQLIFDDDNLLVGAGNFVSAQYDEEKEWYYDLSRENRVDTAILWLAVRDESVPNQHLQLHSGRKITYGEYVIHVVEVRDYTYAVAEGIDYDELTPIIVIDIEKASAN